MRTITGILSEMEESHKAREGKLWQQCFLYPLLFRDDLYAITYNRSSNKLDLRKIENSKLNENFSCFILKCPIHRIHWRKPFTFFSRNYKKKSVLITKTICIWKQFRKALLWFSKLFIPYN